MEINQGGSKSQIWYTQLGKTAIMVASSPSIAYWPTPGGGTAFITANNNGVWYFHKDWLGSARLLSSASSSTISTDRAYAPYGEVYDIFVGTFADETIFTGLTQSVLSGMYDTPNRELQGSTQGRWLSPDPAGSGWNQYAYVTNPNSSADPTGLACFPKYERGCDQNNGGIEGANTGSGTGMWNQFELMGIPVTMPGTYFPPTYWSTTTTLYDSEGNQIGDPSVVFGVQTGGWGDPTIGHGFDLTVGSGAGNGGAANNGNFSWWGAFAKNLFSWKNFTDEFKQGGCVGVFVDAASEGGILPDLPAGHGVEDAVTDASKMAAATYAVNQGLVVPLRSSVVRGILDLGETSASGLVLADTYAKIGAGGLAEYKAIKNGDCH